MEEGGETVFPNGPKEGLDPTGWSPCAQQGPAVKPRKGDVLLFWSLASNGALDNGSLHGGCPVLAGVKWSATKWMHVAPFSEGKVVHNVWELVRWGPAAPRCCVVRMRVLRLPKLTHVSRMLARPSPAARSQPSQSVGTALQTLPWARAVRTTTRSVRTGRRAANAKRTRATWSGMTMMVSACSAATSATTSQSRGGRATNPST